jgi:hypothetical protein
MPLEVLQRFVSDKTPGLGDLFRLMGQQLRTEAE